MRVNRHSSQMIDILPIGNRSAFSKVECEEIMRFIADFFFLVLFFVFLIAWLLAWAAFHVVGTGVHLLVVIAVIFLIAHLIGGRRTV